MVAAQISCRKVYPIAYLRNGSWDCKEWSPACHAGNQTGSIPVRVVIYGYNSVDVVHDRCRTARNQRRKLTKRVQVRYLVGLAILEARKAVSVNSEKLSD